MRIRVGDDGKPLTPSNPKMYFLPFASHLITSTGSTSFVVNNTLGDECSPLTEFYDGTTDRLFFGVAAHRRIPGEFDDHNFADHADMHRRPDIQLCDVPERSRRNQRDCDRQPGVERRDKHLLFDPRGGVCEWPEVQCNRRSRKSPLCRETDPVSSTVRRSAFRSMLIFCGQRLRE